MLAPEMSLINQDKYNKLGKIALDFVRYQEVSHTPRAGPILLVQLIEPRLAIQLPRTGRCSGMAAARAGGEGQQQSRCAVPQEL